MSPSPLSSPLRPKVLRSAKGLGQSATADGGWAMALALFDDVLLDAHRKHEAHVPRIEAAQNRAVVESMQSGAQPIR